jgi:hypothetical protein
MVTLFNYPCPQRMPYFILFEDLPEKRPGGALPVQHERASTVYLAGPGGIGQPNEIGWLRRLLTGRSRSARVAPVSDRPYFSLWQWLLDLGFIQVVISYDGGSDEGFAELESAVTADGTWTGGEVVTLLNRVQSIQLPLDSTSDLDGIPIPMRSRVLKLNMKGSGRIHLRMDEFVDAAAIALLGEGFGTGEYAMLGKFQLDLRTGQVADLLLSPIPDFSQSANFSLDDFYPAEDDLDSEDS